MVVQGGPLPQLFDQTTVDYFMRCSLDVDCRIADLPEPDMSAVTQVSIMIISCMTASPIIVTCHSMLLPF